MVVEVAEVEQRWWKVNSSSWHQISSSISGSWPESASHKPHPWYDPQSVMPISFVAPGEAGHQDVGKEGERACWSQEASLPLLLSWSITPGHTWPQGLAPVYPTQGRPRQAEALPHRQAPFLQALCHAASNRTPPGLLSSWENCLFKNLSHIFRNWLWKF